jgi:transketolase
MRNAFAKEITELAQENPQVCLLSGDIGNRLFNTFKELCGDRFRNCGVAENNMISLGAGMAMAGMHPVAYTIVPFLTTRCYEQIKLDMCYHNVPMTLVSVGGGLAYAELGATHHSFEECGALRILPNLTVTCPADALAVGPALRAAVAKDGPAYIRIGKKNEPKVYEKQPEYIFGRANVLAEGDEICLLGIGNILTEVQQVAVALREKGHSVRVVDFHTLKPLDEELLADIFSRFKLIATMEEHSLIGGLGSAVAEWAVDHGADTRPLIRFGIPDAFIHEAGKQQRARKLCGIDAESILVRIEKRMGTE